jgi:hypothetical protein
MRREKRTIGKRDTQSLIHFGEGAISLFEIGPCHSSRELVRVVFIEVKKLLESLHVNDLKYNNQLASSEIYLVTSSAPGEETSDECGRPGLAAIAYGA